MMETQYSRLAKEIENDIDNNMWFCCLDLSNPKDFKKMYEPTPEELILYNHHPVAWMGEKKNKNKSANNFRIWALLFMHEMTLNPIR